MTGETSCCETFCPLACDVFMCSAEGSYWENVQTLQVICGCTKLENFLSVLLLLCFGCFFFLTWFELEKLVGSLLVVTALSLVFLGKESTSQVMTGF